jgi:hypothetical protein
MDMSDTPNSTTVTDLSDPHQAELLARRLKRMMLISSLTMCVGIAAVLGVIGYRLSHPEGSAASVDLVATLPPGAQIVSTGVSSDRLVVTLNINGTTEVRTFDLKTLKPTGRLTFLDGRGSASSQ